MNRDRISVPTPPVCRRAAFFAGGVCYMFMYAAVYPAEDGKFTGRFTFKEYQEITALCFGVGSLGYTFGR